jgi:hypothetical protein
MMLNQMQMFRNLHRDKCCMNILRLVSRLQSTLWLYRNIRDYVFRPNTLRSSSGNTLTHRHKILGKNWFLKRGICLYGWMSWWWLKSIWPKHVLVTLTQSRHNVNRRSANFIYIDKSPSHKFSLGFPFDCAESIAQFIAFSLGPSEARNTMLC